MKTPLILIFILALALILTGLFYLSTQERFPGPLEVHIEEQGAGENEQEETLEQIESEPIFSVANNLNSPWSIAFYGDVPLVSSRNTGEILEIMNDGSSRTIHTINESLHRGEGGLLGLAVDTESRLYAYYTTATDNRIVRFSISGEPGNISLGQPEIILSGLPNATTHNGGRIAFGPDGMLYATVGDAENRNASQNLSEMHGKILRMTSDGNVPNDNPFENSLVYSYGHRNPQGIAWTENGVMYASEFGQNTWDELNIIEAGGNYGWPTVEGIGNREEFINPIQQWQPSEASPSGIAYADGRLFIANLRGMSLRAVDTSNETSSTTYFNSEFGRIRDAVIAPDGRLWILTNNTDGRGRPSDTDDHIISIDLENL